MGHDPDDWFDEPEVGDTWNARVDRVVRERVEREDWLRESPSPPPQRRRPIRVNRAVVIVGVLALCLFFGILAAAGVFSSSTPPRALPTTTAVPTTTVQTTTTTPKPTVVVPTTPLKPGDTGTEVVQLQKALTAAGYSPGKADGDYGGATTNAVKQFQSAHGLAADGIAGSKTLAALADALRTG
jgi:hypothetical protein